MKYLGDLFVAALLGVMCLFYDSFDPLYRQWFPELEKVIYTRNSMSMMLSEHLELVMWSGLLSVAVGVVAGISFWGRPARSFISTLASGCQSFPPVAVLVLVAASSGFGSAPVIIALFLYGLLPVLNGVFTGLDSISPSVRSAADALGMTRWQKLLRVEMPVSAIHIVSGIRIMMITHIGTATLGSTIGAGGLGAPVIAGIQVNNPPYMIHAAACVSLLAILSDRIFDRIEQYLGPS